MTTVAELIADTRYDLRDYNTGLEFSDEELIIFINRMVRLIDTSLMALNSDLLRDSANLTLTSGLDELNLISDLNTGLWVSLDRIWNGTTLINRLTLDGLFYAKQTGLTSGLPNYWALQNRKVLFDREADQDYTLTVWYWGKTGTLVSTDDIPYYGLLDDWLREMLVVYSRGRKNDNPGRTNMLFQEFAKRQAHEIHITRSTMHKPYIIDF
jgi:hypothetical protein